MFTGIVEARGRLEARDATDGGARLRIAYADSALEEPAVGDSIAVNGTCLTVTACSGDGFTADTSAATLAATTLGSIPLGEALNLESALTLSRPLGGHLVTGHVDGVGGVRAVTPAGGSRTLHIVVPDPLSRFIARKGSVCVDGVSLTVNAVDGEVFEVNVIPHTLSATTLGNLAVGDPVNIEVDLLARYVDRLLARDPAS